MQWHVDVQYEYAVGGASRRGTQVTPGDAQSNANLATYASRFREGGSVTVYYDPQDPRRSVLLPGLNGAHWVGLTAPVLLLGFGGVFGFGCLQLRTGGEGRS